MPRRISLATALVITFTCQADETSRKPEDYPGRVKIGHVILAAENLGPSIPTPSGGWFTSDYIAIEVAVFPEGKGEQALIGHPHFALRINGSKTLLRPDSNGSVAASVKYPDWEQRPRLEAHAGIGDAEVVLGRPGTVARFPGDHRPAEQRGEGRGPVPHIENPVAKKTDQSSVEDLVQRAALPEGNVTLPVSGCLFFYYRGKLKSIKRLELIYEGPLGEASVRIP